jgi:hypothetical protein
MVMREPFLVSERAGASALMLGDYIACRGGKRVEFSIGIGCWGIFDG